MTLEMEFSLGYNCDTPD